MSDRAERFYKSGRPLLFDYLPFWVAIFVDRLVLLLVPMAVVLIPLIRIMPWFYSWRNRRKFFYWYGELKNLELEVQESPQPERVGDYRTRLDRIEAAVNDVHVPLAFFHEAYNLKQHIDWPRETRAPKRDFRSRPSFDGRCRSNERIIFFTLRVERKRNPVDEKGYLPAVHRLADPDLVGTPPRGRTSPLYSTRYKPEEAELLPGIRMSMITTSGDSLPNFISPPARLWPG